DARSVVRVPRGHDRQRPGRYRTGTDVAHPEPRVERLVVAAVRATRTGRADAARRTGGQPMTAVRSSRRRLIVAGLLSGAALLLPVAVSAHPLGNFTINHYDAIRVSTNS